MRTVRCYKSLNSHPGSSSDKVNRWVLAAVLHDRNPMRISCFFLLIPWMLLQEGANSLP